MPFCQPPVTPTPPGVDVYGKTIIITGANQGIGYETARQLLILRASHVVLAVRNRQKGEDARTTLLADPQVKANNPKAVVTVMRVDLESYASVLRFTARVNVELPVLHILILNAGISTMKFKLTPDGHESTFQINYLSNVLITMELLPLLVCTRQRTGAPTRISWVNSRNHSYHTLSPHHYPLLPHESVLGHFDNPEKFRRFTHYGGTKLLGVMFLEDLAEFVPRLKVVINSMCPGMVDTSITDVLPWYLRWPIAVVKWFRARTVEVGAWVVIHAAVVAGLETHGRFLADKEVMPQVKYLETPEGKRTREKLWKETMAEMVRVDEKLTEVLND